jgi:hypothetical protein
MNYVYGFLAKNPCVDCGESNIIVLDFDHLENKKFSISIMIRYVRKISDIEKEMSKCDVRCANCHRKKKLQKISVGIG